MASSGANPIFSPEKRYLIPCVICNEGIKKNEKSQTVTDKTTFKTLAASWACLGVPLTIPENRYTEVLQRIQKLE